MAPQTIISVPVQIAVWRQRAVGAPVMGSAAQVSVVGLYLPPVFSKASLEAPPQTIISEPVHTAVPSVRASGAPVDAVAVQHWHAPLEHALAHTLSVWT